MKEYNFSEFKKKIVRGNYYDGLNVQLKGLYFSKSAYEKMGNPNKVKILIDKEAKAIQIVPSEEGFSVWHKPKCAIMTPAKLTQGGMERGRYKFEGGQNEKGQIEYLFIKHN